MTEKSKFDRKTPSAGFMNFIMLWIVWSVLIGIITIGTLGTITNRTVYNNAEPFTFAQMVLGVLIATVSIYVVSRWQHSTLSKRTGRDFKRWAFWSSVWWAVGMFLSLVVTRQMMVRSGYTPLATIGIIGVGLAIVYGIYGFCQSWLLSQQLNDALPYVVVMVAGVLFWIVSVGDPRRIALGAIIAPALQGLASGITLMWLFHLSKLGNIAMKSKNEELA